MTRALLPGFDAFQQNGWIPYTNGSMEAVYARGEAPFIMYEAPAPLADALVERYRELGLEPTDLRFGVWPDAFPQPARELGEEPGIHLNVFGGAQHRYDQATPPEQRAFDALTRMTVRHVREVAGGLLAHGVTTQEFNEQVPTMHRHIIGRERPEDGTDWVRQRVKISPERRLEIAERVGFQLVPRRRERIAEHLTTVLQDCLNAPVQHDDY